MYIVTFWYQTENTTFLLSLKIAIENHIANVLDASYSVQRTLHILMHNIADGQKGSLPHM
jgi:hypothetical protein